MPTTYAHWAFGRECINLLPKKIQVTIHENRDLYNIGVHGPDILFYDLSHPNITSYGNNMHRKSGEEFFLKCKQIYETHSEKDQILTYILAFLSHFVLDSTVHSYVERKKEVSKITHNHVEAQWDRHLIELDDRTPNLVNRSESLKPSKKISDIISYFLPFTSEEIYRSLRWQKEIVELTNAVSPTKYNFFQKGLKKLNKQDYADLFIGLEEDRKCKDSNIRLDKYLDIALKQYEKLSKNLLDYLEEKTKLDKYFKKNFSFTPDYKNIPVLSFKEELTYKIQ